MKIALTSDFPSTPNEAVAQLMRKDQTDPRIAWIPASAREAHKHFPKAREQFLAHGFHKLDFFNVDLEANQTWSDPLLEYDVIYLSGGDPIEFRNVIFSKGLGDRLRQSLHKGRTIVAASGGAMQLTMIVSLFRLINFSLDEVVRSRGDFQALGIVQYEILPHLNRMDASFSDKVRRYSDGVPHEILALEDGAAILYKNQDAPMFVGEVVRMSQGEKLRSESE